MSLYWRPPERRWRELKALGPRTLPWAVPSVTEPTFVAPGYLAVPDGYSVPRGWEEQLVLEPPVLGDALTVGLGVAAVVVLAGAMALGAWSGTLKEL
jgi:hypothetical protein